MPEATEREQTANALERFTSDEILVYLKASWAADDARLTTGPMDISAANPETFAAISKAQGEVETVGKDGQNDQRGYKYATAEAMIRASRAPLANNGLAVFSTWSRDDTTFSPGGDIGQQFVCATVRVAWVLSHESGGVIRGTAEIDAIGSRARPPDKAIMATLTYVRGFLLRDLLNMDRDEESQDEAVDQRDDRGGWERPARPQSQARPPEQTPVDRLNDIVARVAAARRVHLEVAYNLVEAEANVTPDGQPTPPQVVTLIGAAERLLAAPKESPGATGRARYNTSARAHYAWRTADYLAAEGEEPGAELKKSFWAAIKGLSDKAVDGDFSSKTATPALLTAAADALDHDLHKRKTAAATEGA